MSRFDPTLVLISALALAYAFTGGVPSVASPVPKDGKAKVYFPTKVGAMWVYNEDGKEVIEVVTDVAKDEEGLIVTVGEQLNADKVRQVMKVKVTDKGLFKTQSLNTQYHPPTCFLKLPAKVGEKWEYEVLRGRKVVLTIKGEEKVEVPAGKYDAIRVESPSRTSWYAEGIGLVKSVIEVDGKKHERVLKSFTPGK